MMFYRSRHVTGRSQVMMFARNCAFHWPQCSIVLDTSLSNHTALCSSGTLHFIGYSISPCWHVLDMSKTMIFARKFAFHWPQCSTNHDTNGHVIDRYVRQKFCISLAMMFYCSQHVTDRSRTTMAVRNSRVHWPWCSTVLDIDGHVKGHSIRRELCFHWLWCSTFLDILPTDHTPWLTSEAAFHWPQYSTVLDPGWRVKDNDVRGELCFHWPWCSTVLFLKWAHRSKAMVLIMNYVFHLLRFFLCSRHELRGHRSWCYVFYSTCIDMVVCQRMDNDFSFLNVICLHEKSIVKSARE